jgi:hypothetical protein
LTFQQMLVALLLTGSPGCGLAGNVRAIGTAVRNNKVAQHFTGLEWRLREKVQGSEDKLVIR